LLADTPLEIPENATVRKFTFDGHNSINDKKMDMNRIDEVVPSGALEIWDVESDGNPHTFHIHGATFHVLEVEGEQPPPHLRGPKDTVPVASDHAVKLAVQFVTHIDPDVPFMYHCHILKHEDNGMMGQFVIVEPGMEDATPRTLDSGHASH
jgi:FtsP/CotA-like multicopper oxidase with cupredoxin domain